jgi:hypothetical protein
MLKHGHGQEGPREIPPELRALGYEPRDIGIRAIILWVGGLFAGAIITIILTTVFYKLVIPESAEAQSASPLLTQRRLPPPGMPILQANPVRDLREFAEKEKIKTEVYDVESRQKGTYRIPVERAIEVLAERGLPVQGGASPTTGQPISSAPGKAKVGLPGPAATGERLGGGRRSAVPAAPVPSAAGGGTTTGHP